MTRTIVIGIATGAIALIIACSSDNSNSSGGSSGSTSSSGGSGSATGFKSCNTSSSSGTSTCTEAELKPYGDCVQTACDSKYKECYGPDYKSGTFSGACGTYITCTQKCDCNAANYSSCVSACVLDSACGECSKGFLGCIQTCTLPACATAGSSSGTSGSTGTATCATLQTCCDKLTGSAKTQCDSAKSQAAGNDQICSAYYQAYKSQCP
jgi:hypothetical protein